MRRQYPFSPVVGVGAIIVEGGRLVLVRRGTELGLGKWRFPGGTVDLGEAVRDAVIRETEEECGLDVELTQDTPMDVHDIKELDELGRLRYHYVLLQFLVQPKDRTLKPTSDVTDARWVSLKEVEKYNLTESVHSFFRKRRKELEKHY